MIPDVPEVAVMPEATNSPESIRGLSYWEIQFDPTGTLLADAGLKIAVAAGDIDDLFVFSHGWNSGTSSSRSLYHGLFGLIADQLGARLERTAAVGVFWPSLLFPGDDPTVAAPAAPPGQHGATLAAALAPAFPAQTNNLA